MVKKETKRQLKAELNRRVRSHKVETSVRGTSILRHLDVAGQQHKVIFTPAPPPQPSIPPLGPPPNIKIPAETEVEEDEREDRDVKADQTQVSSSNYYSARYSLLAQTRTVINEFMAIEDKLQELLLRDYHNPHEHEICLCGKGRRLVKCRYDGCFQYPTSCRTCFISKHRLHPLHWALIWDTGKRIWTQHDYSEVSDNPAIDSAIQLGHQNNDDPCPGTKNSIPFIITHTNGVHATRIRFCGCLDSPDRLEQLMAASLFPATASDCKSAFTHEVLKNFHMHNLQSKCGAFDFIYSLRRLTDNVFTVNVPVSIFIK